MDINGGTPRSSTLMGLSIINHPFLGHLHLWKPPYETSRCLGNSRLLGSVTTRQPQRRTKAARCSERRVLLASRPNKIKQRECLKIHRCHTKTRSSGTTLDFKSASFTRCLGLFYCRSCKWLRRFLSHPMILFGIPWYPMVSHGIPWFWLIIILKKKIMISRKKKQS